MSDMPMPSLEIEYYSMFLWGRPPMPANVANHLAQLVCDQHVQSVLAVGVTSPTALAALGYSDPSRTIVVICPKGQWGEKYSNDEDDWPPKFDPYLPVRIRTTADVLTRMHFDLVYIDNDFALDDDFEPERLARAIQKSWTPKLVALGFCDGFQSPTRLFSELKKMGFNFSEISGKTKNCETRQTSTQMLAYALAPSEKMFV